MRRASLLTALLLFPAACSSAPASDAPTTTAVAATSAATVGTSTPATPTTTGATTTAVLRVRPEGDPAPDFSLALGEGGTFVLSEEHRPVFLLFWAEW